jgi:nuclear transport factor 2 (NTF2) superfamily protein
MVTQDQSQASGRNPQTFEEAVELVRSVEALTRPFDPEGMANGFSEDVIVRYGVLPEMRGRQAMREFYDKRSKRQKNHEARKVLRAMMGNVLAIDFYCTWEDAQTGARMHGHGVEIWEMRDGKIAVWDVAMNIGDRDVVETFAIV